MSDKNMRWEIDSINIPSARWDLANLLSTSRATVQGRFFDASLTIEEDKSAATSSCSVSFMFSSTEDSNLISELEMTVEVNYSLSFSSEISMIDIVNEIHVDSISYLANTMSNEAARIVKSAGIQKPFTIGAEAIAKSIPTRIFTEEMREDDQSTSVQKE